jgi:hypothetical protein
MAQETDKMASNVRVGFINSNAFEDHGCLLHGVNDEMQTQTHHDSFFTPPAESLHGSSYHDVPVSYVAEHLAYPADASLKRSHDELETREQAAAKRLKAAAAKKVNSEQWDAMFERVVAYKAQHGVRSRTLEGILIFLRGRRGFRTNYPPFPPNNVIGHVTHSKRAQCRSKHFTLYTKCCLTLAIHSC